MASKAVQAGRGDVKYQRVCEVLRSEIMSGRYADGAAMPSEAGVMRRFGVGRQTAIRAFAELQCRGLIVRRKGAGTFLSAEAKRRTGRIALIVHGSDYCEIFAPIARRISHLCMENDRTLLFADVSQASVRQRVAQLMRQAREYVRMGVDGVILQPVELVKNAVAVNKKLVDMFDAAHIPVVLLDSDIVPSPERSKYDLAAVNHFDAGRRLAAHLKKAGARRIAYLWQALRAPCVQERYLGVRTGCEELSCKGMSLVAEPTDTARIGRFLKRERPDAFACYNDRQAVLLVKTLAEIGVSVPKDVLVAGFDDVNYARLATPQLTTMRQPCAELADLAFDMLMVRIGSPSAPAKETLLNAPLVIRESTMRPRGKSS